jgi:hypothetical protein
MFMSTQTLQAWSAIDVLVLGAILCKTQIPQFVDFIQTFGILKPTCLTLKNTGIKCFTIDVEYESGIWIMFATALLQTVTCYWVFRKVQKSMKSRTETYDAKQLAEIQGFGSMRQMSGVLETS